MKQLFLFVTIMSIVIANNLLIGQNEVVHPTKVTTAIYFDVLPSLKDLPPVDDQYYIDNEGRSVADGLEHEHEGEATDYSNWKKEGSDPVWQKEGGWVQNNSKALIQNFAGQSSPYMPSDCNGTVGPNHFMQTVNTTYAVYNKTGTKVAGPTAMNSLFSGVTGSGNNDGDPLTLYDEQAGKWVAVEFSISSTPYYMLIAVSQTNDPTGAWWRWSFQMNGFPDYEKMGIWHDGYYMGSNLGSTSSSLDDVYVFERSVMIAGGASPKQVQFHNPNRPNSAFHAIMPLDADGTAAPSTSPGQFITINDNAWGGADELWIYECTVNWTTPTSSTFSRTQQLAVPGFDSQFNSWGVGDIAQQAQSQKVDAQPYVLMARGQYKNWGTAQSLVCVHTVDVDATNHAGERWYELTKTSQTDPTWAIRQSGTYAPDSHSRYMGSIAINDNHEIALGYSISSSTMSPNIRYCGQSASENATATGIMDIAETGNLATGVASQPTYNRWGDYSLMTIDPVDGTTFWYTNEYYSSGKKTRIMSFTLPAPVLTADFTAIPTTVNVGNTVTFTDASFGPNTINSWTWSFPGGTPSTATGAGPHVITYNTVGNYNASLTVTDVASGSNTQTKTNYIHVFNCTISSFPFTENFDSWTSSSPAFNCTADGTVTLGQCWTNVSGDNIDWDIISGATGSSTTGPSSDHTSGSGKYLYTESSSCFGSTGSFTSPYFDLTSFGSADLIFWYHMYGADMGTLSVQVSTNGGSTWSGNVWSLSGNQGNSWQIATVSLNSYVSSSNVVIRFTGLTGTNYRSDMAIDDVSILVGPELSVLWTGTTGTDWNVGTNWSGGSIPTAIQDVTIPAAPSGGNFPETNTGATAVCQNMTIASGAHVYVPVNNSLTVNANLVNNGGITGLVIQSDTTGTGSLINASTGVRATVNRYLTDGRWHFIGMPVGSALAGVFHLPSGHSNVYLRTHVEATNTWDNFIVPVGTPLNLGRGYEVWVGTPGGFTQPETIEFSGFLNAGDYTTGLSGFYGLQFTTGHGLNLISNPYPSALQANISSWTKTNVANSIWTWSDAAGNYVYWNGVNGSNGNGYGTLTGGVIPAMQGFFVLGSASGLSLTIPQADRIHSSQAYYKNVTAIPNTLQLSVAGNAYEDAIFVHFDDNATQAYDENLDVIKLFGLPDAPQLYSMIPDEQLSIDAVPELDGYQFVQLGFECDVNGDFTFMTNGLEGFTDYVPVYLKDTKEGILQKLNDDPQYNFTYETSDDPTRFELHFGELTGIQELSSGDIQIYSNNDWVYIQSENGLEGEVSVFDMLGQEIIRQKAGDQKLIQLHIEQGTGYYLVKLNSVKQAFTGKVFIK